MKKYSIKLSGDIYGTGDNAMTFMYNDYETCLKQWKYHIVETSSTCALCDGENIIEMFNTNGERIRKIVIHMTNDY